MNSNSRDPLGALIYSTKEFYKRFGVKPQLENATRVFEEEVHELIEAAHAAINTNHIAEEAADVIVTVIGLCEAAGVESDKLIEQIYAVVSKNDAKTHDTHVFLDGKIRRRHPKPEG